MGKTPPARSFSFRHLTFFRSDGIISAYGELSERFKEPVLKTGDGATHREFESHTLRQKERHPPGFRFFWRCRELRFEGSNATCRWHVACPGSTGATHSFLPVAKMQTNLHSPPTANPPGCPSFWRCRELRFEGSNATCRWHVACPRLDGGNTLKSLISWKPCDLVIECALRALDEVASSASGHKKTANPIGFTVSLELLARFELATSSLPTISEHFLPCAAYRKLLDKTLVYQGLFGFAYRCLL